MAAPRPPIRFSAVLSVLLLLLLLPVACSSDADRVTEAGLARTEAVNALLVQNRGDTAAALKAVEAYELQHRAEIVDARKDGAAVLQKLSESERAAHTEKWGPQIMEKRAKTEALLRTFDEPRDLVRLVSRVLN